MKQKQPYECRSDIVSILQPALESGIITKLEYDKALTSDNWTAIQPILDKAQSVSTSDDLESLKSARLEHPLDRSSFTESELEKLRALAPEEYELIL